MIDAAQLLDELLLAGDPILLGILVVDDAIPHGHDER
jgi:hypothetical protein